MKKQHIQPLRILTALFFISAFLPQTVPFVAGNSVYAQDNGTPALEDELFGSDEDIFVDASEAHSADSTGTASGNAAAPMKFQADLKNIMLSLENDKLRIGGSIDSSVKLNCTWNELSDPLPQSTFNTNLDAALFFDARPVENLKLYGKFIFGFPFEKTPNSAVLSVPSVPNIAIRELYTDFSFKDTAFFRFGKHAVKWGTGYFYSPADVINISRIDPQNIDADKEGPLSLRAHIVIPNTQHNIWLYLLPPTDNGFKTEYTAFAAKADFVFGNWELGIGGRYKYKDAPKLIATASGSVAGKVAVFGEAVFSWGSDYIYYKSPADLNGYKREHTAFFQATAGASYNHTKTHTAATFQYFYNGFGYADTQNVQAIRTAAARQLKANNPADAAVEAAKNIGAMGDIGQHYIACTISQNKIGTEKVGAKLFQQFSVCELQGLSVLTFTWNPNRFVGLNAGPSVSYPLSSDSQSKTIPGFNISCKLGGGKF